jgi:hypothetical protein
MRRHPLAHVLVRHACAELRRLARIRGAHRRTARRIAEAHALLAFAAALLDPGAADAAPRFRNPRAFFGAAPAPPYARPAFVDLDGDGDLEEVVGTEYFGFQTFTNTGTATAPAFRATGGNPPGVISSGSHDVPAFGDLDGDGDQDLLSGDQFGTTRFHENTGTATAPAFAAFITAPFGLPAAVSVYASPFLADLDGDGDLDALFGEVYAKLHWFENTGTAVAPAFGADVTNPFGLAGTPLAAHPELGDLDDDGDLDLLVGATGGETFLFRNTGTPAAPAFAAPEVLPLGIEDPGRGSAPALADLDGDGDLDLAMGEYFGSTIYQENTGTATAPAFAPSSTNSLGLPAVPDARRPALADLDGDGDLDLLYGTTTGGTSWVENTGTATAPAFAAPVASPFALGAVASDASPALADLDGDGNLDAWIGEYAGTVALFPNTGTAGAPAFGAATTSAAGLADAGAHAAPAFADLDGDGDLDAFVGNSTLEVLLFENTGAANAPAFAGPVGNPFGLSGFGFRGAPAFADLDGDGDLDGMVGTLNGVPWFNENTGTATSPAFLPRDPPRDVTPLGGAATPAFGDIDADGDSDLFVGSFGSTFFFENTSVDCPAARTACAGTFAKARLKASEKKAGRESLAFSLAKGPALAQAELGDPRKSGDLGVALCIYRDTGQRVATLPLERAGETCGTKPCWKPLGGAPPKGAGWRYRDSTGAASGFRSLDLKGGAAGRTKLVGKATNDVTKGQLALPIGITPALAGTTSVTLQLRTSRNHCLAATLPTVKRSTNEKLDATLP